MSSDSDRVSTPGVSRGRLSRNASRIPAPRRTSRAAADQGTSSTPRRVSQAPVAENETPDTPRRASLIPRARRLSKAGADGPQASPLCQPRATPESRLSSGRRLSRTATKSQAAADSTTPGSHRRATFSTTPVQEKRRSDEDNPIARARKANLEYRRTSSANEEPRESRFTAGYARRHPAAGAANDSSSRIRTPGRADDRAQLPDRGTEALSEKPSPATGGRRTMTNRPVLQASPYARRTSRGATAIPRGGGTAPVTRKLNMAPTNEADEEDRSLRRKESQSYTSARRTSLAANQSVEQQDITPSRRESLAARRESLAARRESIAARRESLAARRESLTASRRDSLASTRRDSLAKNSATKTARSDRADTRRESAASKTQGRSALESFRAARRASVKSSTATADPGEPSEAVLTKSGAQAQSLARSSGQDNIENEGPALPDRIEAAPSTGKATSSAQSLGRPSARVSNRFSDANVCLDDVNRLRKSLGRRRSASISEDGKQPSTPTLGRSRFAKPATQSPPEDAGTPDAIHPRACVELNFDSADRSDDGLQRRSPLRSIPEHGENVAWNQAHTNSAIPKKRNASEISQALGKITVPTLDDDDNWENEEVEDLSAA